MNRKQLIKKYMEFFVSKGHKKVPNAPLVPENDPTVLFTTAGMHPLVPYLLGQPHPLGKRVCNVQKCIRTIDIDEVGDTTHHTFFEMLGNWSLGDYFKKGAIEMSFEFLTRVLKIPVERLAVSCFQGDDDAPKDNESAKIWEGLGMTKEKIAFLPKKDNWWGPAGKTGPCGPDTEMFYWKNNKIKAPKKFDPKDENWVEIWNDVLMEYIKDEKGRYNPAKQQNVDTGMGTERTVAILNGLEDNYLADMWKPIIDEIEHLTGKKYYGNEREIRIIADHIKAAVFIIADGIVPGNVEQGYVLRRLIRRAIRNMNKLGMTGEISLNSIGRKVIEIYDDYEELQKNKKRILEEIDKESERFVLTLEKGINKFNKIIEDKNSLDCKDAFLLYQSFGFPIELTKEMAKEKGIKVDEKGFEEECQIHQELSRTASAGRFKSGLADNSEATTRLHTATHLLMSALRIILDDENIMQKGSNITPNRLRLDFNFPRKLTQEELNKVEDLVNAQIQEGCEVVRKEMSPEEAKKKGAVGVFDAKYGEKVSVYSVGDFSKEICSGPHVENVCELGKFKIKKEESSSAGVRRIKAVLE